MVLEDGQAEPGESLAATAIREDREETCLAIRVGRRLGHRQHPATGRDITYLAAEPLNGAAAFVADRTELAEVRWCGTAEARRLLPGMFAPVHVYLTTVLRDNHDE